MKNIFFVGFLCKYTESVEHMIYAQKANEN